MGIKGKNVFVIEDDPNIRELYNSVLSAAGLIVFAFEKAIDAMEMLESSIPHLVILDMSFLNQETTGLKVLSFIRNRPSLTNIPVMIISSDTQKMTIYKALALGADDYQIKPISPKSLIQKVRKIFLDYNESKLSFINEFTQEYDANFNYLFEGDFEVKLQVPAQVTAINEFSCLISAPVKFEKNENISLKSVIGREVGQEDISLRVSENGKSVAAATFITKCSLVAIKEEVAQKLRKIRGQA
ncbi:MAG: DNA-binding response OmpR family regulator [Bacteriovoracaceae bacterium]|jgi:DNA-binding response OmpR family regulator